MDSSAYVANADQILHPRSYPPARPWRLKRGTSTTVLGVVILAAMIAAAVRDAGQFLVVDNARPSEVIVVLGGDDGSRLPKAIQLLESGYAKEVIVDADAGRRWLGRTEADRAAAQIMSMGLIASRIHVCPTIANSTVGETRDFSDCVHAKASSRIILVTSAYHTRRALSTFRRALPQYEWSAASATNDDLFGTSWWQHSAWATTTAGEWEKLLWWEVVERWTI